MEFRIGQGYDVHAMAVGIPMYLAGIPLEESAYGFVAHSDGDVAIHALCDALLGAAAMGDIGEHFPDTSPEWAGIDSKILLHKVMEMLSAEGWQVVNADITIALQAPRIRPRVARMRAALAPILGVGTERVNIKATTGEQLGFVGRGEGCQVWAVALIQRQ